MSQIKDFNAQEITASCLLILTGIALTATMMYLKTILIPLTLAIFLYFLVTPMIEWMHLQLKMPRAVALLSSFVVGIGLFVLTSVTVMSSIREFIQSAGIYQYQFETFMDSIDQFLRSWGVQIDLAMIEKELQPRQVFSLIQNITGRALGFIGYFLLINVFLIFLLASHRPNGQSPEWFAPIKQRVSKYVWTKLFISGLTGLLVMVILISIGLELAVMFGVLAFLLNFIPSIGSIAATFLPLPLALVQFGLGVESLLVVLLPGAIQISVGNVLEPKMMGANLDMHPITVLVFLIFWGLVWGVPGMFLAVPITAVLQVSFERFPRTKPLAEVMAGRIS